MGRKGEILSVRKNLLEVEILVTPEVTEKWRSWESSVTGVRGFDY